MNDGDGNSSLIGEDYHRIDELVDACVGLVR